MNTLTWHDHCLVLRGTAADHFIQRYIAESHRKLLLIAGAGFDPRTTVIAKSIVAQCSTIEAKFLKEELIIDSPPLADRAARNWNELIALLPGSEVIPIAMFADDGAAVGGREAARIASQVSLEDYTDVVVDCSALSKGVFFPLVKQLLASAVRMQSSANIHVMVVDEPTTDDEIVITGSDKAGTIHGFKGGLGLAANNRAARLWVPQLISNQKAVLDRIYSHAEVEPHDVCPVLPFPSSDPRRGDKLIEEYAEEFESVWSVDPRNIVYASDTNPLDLYRTLIRINNARQRVFNNVGGSILIISPIGSKVAAIGALMAAIDCDFPVVTVEPVSYTVDFDKLDRTRHHCGDIVHLWLYGEAHPNYKSIKN